MGQKRRQYSAAFKFKIALEAVRNGKTINQIAGEHNLHPNQVSTWKRALLSEGRAIFERAKGCQEKEREKRERALYEQVGRLKMELEWLKKTTGID